jgi:Tol biopolymer transport system component
VLFTDLRLFEIDVRIANRARMSIDGTDVRRLTFNAADDVWPRWPPNGKQIAFHSNADGGDFERYTVNADGADLTRVTNRCFVSFVPRVTIRAPSPPA